MILKDKIYAYTEELGSKEFSTVYDLVKEYFRMNIIDGISNFVVIEYRGYNLNISDVEGNKDAIEIIEELEKQINEINNYKDIER